MKIVICGSMSMHVKMFEVKSSLELMGHDVVMPGTDNINEELDKDGNSVESAHIKIRDDLIRDYYEKIKKSDAVLVVNENRKGLEGYIGGNTFLEIGFAHVLRKKLYILNRYSDQLSYFDEINAMQPVVLRGDLSALA